MLDVSIETEWYENVRNGLSPICDRCADVKGEMTNINIEQFQYNRYGDKTFCEGCWNWIHLKKWKCDTCGLTGSLRSEKLPIKVCCGREVSWYQ